ncbi:MAG: hypothetical protein AB1634_09235 [Thermodesulfobacteriota bacterium]
MLASRMPASLARHAMLVAALSCAVGLTSTAVADPPPPPPPPPGTYTASAHGSATSGVDRSTVDGSFASLAKGNCGHCHEQHASVGGSEPLPNAPPGPSLALGFGSEEALCETCHNGTVVSRDVAAQVDKAYGHPIDDPALADRHSIGKKEAGQNGLPFRGTKRHVECADCHEPHSIGSPGSTLHSFQSGSSGSNNLVSNPIKGVWGVEVSVEPSWGSAATASFTEQKPATKEYQICFKCHTYYALQDGDGVTILTGPSGQLVTDQAVEFSKSNRSVHPVRVGLTSQTASVAPKALTAAQMKTPWDTELGTQTMYCSDCHGNDTTAPTDGRGPHGADSLYMLAGPDNTEWPRASLNSDELWDLDDVRNNRFSWSTKLLCAKCHVLYSGGAWTNGVHTAHDSRAFDDNPWKDAYINGVPCVTCHVAVPHGSKRSRLIGYRTDPEPYLLLDDKHGNAPFPVVTGFKKASTPSSYAGTHCYLPAGTGCGSHGTNDGGYDP